MADEKIVKKKEEKVQAKPAKKIEKTPESKKPEKKEEKKTEKRSGFLGFGKKKEQPRKEETLSLKRDSYEVLKFVLMTEKAVRQIELQNKLVFIVDRKSDKSEIKAAAQAAFNSQISGVTTVIDQSGRKKAFVKFREPGAAGDIAVRLGII